MSSLSSEVALFSDEMTLRDARNKLRELVDDGYACPCCTQFAKVYRRKVNSSMARGLIAAYHAHGREYGYLQDVRRVHGQTDNREESKLRYWGLMEEEADIRRDDGGRAGWWRVTERGETWALGTISIPKYARIYDGRLLNLVPGEQVTILDALGDRFNYRELMEGG